MYSINLDCMTGMLFTPFLQVIISSAYHQFRVFYNSGNIILTDFKTYLPRQINVPCNHKSGIYPSSDGDSTDLDFLVVPQYVFQGLAFPESFRNDAVNIREVISGYSDSFPDIGTPLYGLFFRCFTS